MIVTNSSPIIVLGKQGRLQFLEKCFRRVIIPKAVYAEVLCKKESPEGIALEKAVKDKWVSVEAAEVSSLLRTGKLGLGEKEAISLAEKHKALLLIDDDSVKSYASMLGVEAHGTLFVVYLAYARGFISRADAKGMLDTAIANGFYISTEVYSKFVNLLNSIK